MKVRTFNDLLEGHETAEICCLYTGQMVRKLSRGPGGSIVLDPMVGDVLTVPGGTVIKYEPWAMDRGSLIFFHDVDPYRGQPLKLCGEGDPIRFDDGTEDRVYPVPNAPEHPHYVQMVCNNFPDLKDL
jgi:hypothetical protein